MQYSHNMTLLWEGVEIDRGFAMESEIKVEQKFNPMLPSYIIAINEPTREGDIEVIRDFCEEGVIIELEGNWKSQKERSYQIAIADTDFADMEATLKFLDQEAFLILNDPMLGAGVYIYNYKYMTRDCYPTYLGKMVECDGESDDCTYCPTTKTYWKAER